MTQPLDRDPLEAIERGERWLAGFETPSPTPAQLSKFKAAAREEINRRATALSIGRGWGVLAAAATITLAVTIGWYGGLVPSGTMTSVADASNDDIEPASVVVVNRVEDNLSTLETWSRELAWDLTGAALSQAMDELYNDSAENGAVRRNNS